jgi:hypothetical protein
MADHDPNHTGGRSRLGRMGEHETVSHDIPMSDQLTAAIAAGLRAVHGRAPRGALGPVP